MRYLKIRVLIFGILTMTIGLFPILELFVSSHGRPFANTNDFYYLVSPVSLILLLTLLILYLATKGNVVSRVIKILSPLASLTMLVLKIGEYFEIMNNQHLSVNPIYLILDITLIILAFSFVFDVNNKMESSH